MRLHAQLVGESLVFARCVFVRTPYSTDGALRAFLTPYLTDGALRAFLAASFKYGTDVRLYRVKSVQQGRQPVQLGQQGRDDVAWEWYRALRGRELKRTEHCFWHPLGR